MPLIVFNKYSILAKLREPIQGMLGTGRARVSEVCELARANVRDGVESLVLSAFSSLGAGGAHQSNQERDLHKWLHSIYGVKLTPYRVTMDLTVLYATISNLCF